MIEKIASSLYRMNGYAGDDLVVIDLSKVVMIQPYIISCSTIHRVSIRFSGVEDDYMVVRENMDDVTAAWVEVNTGTA